MSGGRRVHPIDVPGLCPGGSNSLDGVHDDHPAARRVRLIAQARALVRSLASRSVHRWTDLEARDRAQRGGLTVDRAQRGGLTVDRAQHGGLTMDRARRRYLLDRRVDRRDPAPHHVPHESGAELEQPDHRQLDEHHVGSGTAQFADTAVQVQEGASRVEVAAQHIVAPHENRGEPGAQRRGRGELRAGHVAGAGAVGGEVREHLRAEHGGEMCCPAGTVHGVRADGVAHARGDRVAEGDQSEAALTSRRRRHLIVAPPGPGGSGPSGR